MQPDQNLHLSINGHMTKMAITPIQGKSCTNSNTIGIEHVHLAR